MPLAGQTPDHVPEMQIFGCFVIQDHGGDAVASLVLKGSFMRRTILFTTGLLVAAGTSLALAGPAVAAPGTYTPPVYYTPPLQSGFQNNYSNQWVGSVSGTSFGTNSPVGVFNQQSNSYCVLYPC
ncbi:hypothetical protein ODJ79_04540 [Actinoplanes sp. KI2]|uniref:hypothetical protein n=1 Tax=Actinoplanes sp. KI2 TaxID=2983315 RepID=UPI0021D5B294|nr:hypothetical protein [Actinoplanes sp. KI2]MCU7722975.1 hypothetical protein [Actinoplanes sp. KI2]